MPGYEGSSSETDGTHNATNDTITIKGTLCFIFAPKEPAKPVDGAQYLKTMSEKGYKIGLRVKKDQRVERLAFAGTHGEVVLREDAKVTQELEQAFKCQGDERWVGLVPPTPGERKADVRKDGQRLIVCYEFTLSVSNVKCRPQPVTMVLTYAKEPFAPHYLLHILILSERPRIKITTEAVY